MIHDVEEVRTDLNLHTLLDLELPVNVHIPLNRSWTVEDIARGIAERSQRYATGVANVGCRGATAREGGGIEILGNSLRERIHAENHIGPVGSFTGEGNVRPGGDTEGLAGVETDDRRKLPTLGHYVDEAVTESRALDYQRAIEDMPAVEVAIALFGVAVVGILIVVGGQLAAEVVGAGALRPSVVRQPGDMVG